MHEISLCQNTLEIIEKHAREHNVSRITGVWLELGALSCVEESALRFSFDIVCCGTLAEGCQLHIVHRAAQAWCWDCSRQVDITQHEAICPYCSGSHLKVENGDGLQIKEIEVE